MKKKAKTYFEKMVQKEIEALFANKEEINLVSEDEHFRITFGEDFVDFYFLEADNFEYQEGEDD